MVDASRKSLESIVNKIASDHKFINPAITYTPIQSDGANYTSKLFSVLIKDEMKELKLFSKVIIMGDKLRAQTPQIYEIEILVYSKLSKVYEKLQVECHIAAKDRLEFAKYYGGSTKRYEEVIVLEDLVAQGYSTFDRLKSIDWPYASAAVEELAKMHALSLAYKIQNPKEFAEVVDDLKVKMGPFATDLTFCFSSVNEKALESVREENKERLKAYFDRFVMADFWKGKTLVLVHTDFKPNNLLYRTREDGTIEMKIVDLQTVHAASPIVDLLYFIFTGSDEQFRGSHFHRLLEHYYHQLSAAITRLHLQPELVYSREEFYTELKEKLHYGLAIAVFTLPFMTVDMENAHVVTDDSDVAGFFAVNTSALYASRLNGVVDDCIRWGVL